MKKVLLTILGTGVALFSLLCTGCGTEPRDEGQIGTAVTDKPVYTGTKDMMVVTVSDADLVDAPSVAVTSDDDLKGITVQLVKVSTGKFSKSVTFTTGRSGTGDTIQVSNNSTVTVTYSDLKPVGSRVAKVLWKSVDGNVYFDATSYTSVIKPMIISVSDMDVSDASVLVTVNTSSSSATNLVTLKSTGSYGLFSGQIVFSTKVNNADTLLVKDKDTVLVTYTDVMPNKSFTSRVVWNGFAGILSIDSASYKGQSKMTITVEDSDVQDSILVVQVKSEKDPAGIMVTLKANAGKFTGQVGFSYGASKANSIAAADSDTVTVIYNDAAPKATVTKTAVYYMGLIPALGIFSSLATPGAIQVPGLLTNLFTWSGTCTVDSVPNFTGTGNAVRITAGFGTWAGFGWAQVNAGGTLASLNMTAFAQCSLHVRLKGNANGIKILVENQSHAGQTFLATSTYGYINDEQWHEIVIPLTAWSGTCDLSNVDYFMGATFDPYAGGQYIIVDDLYWTLPTP